MVQYVCPWWLGYFLINPLRRWRQDPHQILTPYVHEGMTALEPGPGMGFFTLELARLVGPAGRVVAVDVQNKMLEKLRHRAVKQRLQERIEIRLVGKDSMALGDLNARVDFALAFAVVHEFPAAAQFFRQVAETLKPGGTLLLAEPKGHVKQAMFDKQLSAAADAGLAVAERPRIAGSHTALLRK
ncbi:MAG: class I SAM-dependent methyltransferase [Deltaproteobacteria bacterium]